MNSVGFRADLDSGRRVLAHARPETRLEAFTQFSREGIRWHRVGGLPKSQVIDGLRDIGIEAGLGEDEVQGALAVAVENPFEPSSREPSRHEGKVPLLDWRSRCTTAAALQSQTFPPVSYIVPGLLPEGLTLLAGKPKIGKSWLALDVCLGVAGARPCLGGREAPPSGDVLYLALEDNPRRLQRRMDRLLKTFSDQWPARLTFSTSWLRLDEGGVEHISQWMASVREPRLIVIDTLAAVRPLRKTSGYTEDYEALSSLHHLANERAISILVLHHQRKMEADDPIDSVSGTLGLSGCADTILVLSRTAQGTTLYLRGRDVEEAEHAMQFDTDICRWTILGSAAEVHRSAERGRIMAILEGRQEVATTEIVDATGMLRRNVDKLLHHMTKDGDVTRVKRGVFRLAEPPR
jgi:hypothetical protein